MRAVGLIGILLMVTLAFVALRLLAGPSDDLRIAEVAFFAVVIGGFLFALLLRLTERWSAAFTKRFPNAGFFFEESYIALNMIALVYALISLHLYELLCAALLIGAGAGAVAWNKTRRRKPAWVVASTSAYAVMAAGGFFYIKFGDKSHFHIGASFYDLWMWFWPMAYALLCRVVGPYMRKAKRNAPTQMEQSATY